MSNLIFCMAADQDLLHQKLSMKNVINTKTALTATQHFTLDCWKGLMFLFWFRMCFSGFRLTLELSILRCTLESFSLIAKIGTIYPLKSLQSCSRNKINHGHHQSPVKLKSQLGGQLDIHYPILVKEESNQRAGAKEGWWSGTKSEAPALQNSDLIGLIN